MALMDDDETRDHLLNQVRKALAEAGLHDYEVQSIRLNMKNVRRCPDGQDPVWGSVTQPDGSVVYQWVCPKP